MGRFYNISYAAAATTTETDLFEITCATDKPIKVWGWFIYQTTDLGDSAEEVVSLTLQRGVTAGSGGSSVTPAALVENDTAAGATCNRSVTTAHTGGTVIWRGGWNIRIPAEFWFTPETAPVIGADADPVTLTMTVPADSITVGGSLIFEELA